MADAVDEGELGIQMTPEPATTQTETTLELEELNPEERLALDEVAAVPETADLPVEEAAETEPNSEAVVGESDTIHDSRPGAQSGGRDEQSEER